MKTIPFVIVFVFLAICTLGQESSSNFPKKNFYKKGKIKFRNTQYLHVVDLSIEGDSLSFKKAIDRPIEKMSFTQIVNIQIIKGTKVIPGAILGAALPFVFILEPLLDNEPNPKNTGLRVAGVVGGAALIGAIIGSQIPVWETYSLKKDQNIGWSMGCNLNASSNMIGAQLVIHF